MAEVVSWYFAVPLQERAERKLVCATAPYIKKEKKKTESDWKIGSNADNAQEEVMDQGRKRDEKEKKISGEIRSEKAERY